MAGSLPGTMYALHIIVSNSLDDRSPVSLLVLQLRKVGDKRIASISIEREDRGLLPSSRRG